MRLEVLGKIRRDAVGLLHLRIDLGVGCLGGFDLPLNLADGGEVFIQLAAVAGPEPAFQRVGGIVDEIEDAAAIDSLALLGFRREDYAVAEQALKEIARIESWRQGYGFAFPCQIVGIRAGVTGITIAGLTAVFHADLDRRKAHFRADLIGNNLVERDAGVDIGKRFLYVNAG